MALTKEKKREVQAQYEAWLEQSQAVFLVEYTGMNMPAFDALRHKVRAAGGEFHVVKNTLSKRAFEAQGFTLPGEYFLGSTAVGFAFEDAPAMAKILSETAKELPAVKIKGGLLDGQLVSAAEVRALADLPPLPVMRAHLLRTILAPASKIVRTLAEPGRQIAQVLKSFADAEADSAAPA